MPQQISHPITLIAQITKGLVRTVFKTALRRNLLLASGLAIVAVTVLYFARPARAANIEWSGAGADNNWSTGANWLGGVAPGSGDVAVFVGGSPNQNKNATIDISFTVDGIQINPTYGGFMTQTTGTTLMIGNLGYVQNGASGFSINAGGTVNLSFGPFQVTGGTFNAGGGTLIFNDLTINLTGGRFIAPGFSRTMTFAQGGSNQFTRSGSATFEHNGGTVVISGNSQVSWQVNGPGTAGTEVFNNLTINAITGLNIDNLDTLQVLGALALTNGFVGGSGTLQAEDTISIANTFDGGPATLLIVGPPRTVTIPTGITGPFLSTTLNSSGSILNSSGPGTITTARLNLVLGTIESGASDWVVNTSYMQSGGTFTGGTGSLAFNISAAFNLSGGVFNGPNTINFNDNDIALTGGQFVAPAGTMSFLQGASNQFNHFTPAIFTHNGGTILLSGGAQLGWHIEGIGTPGTDVLNNLTVNTTSGINLDAGDTLRITGALSLTNGRILNGIFQPEADVSIGAAFDGGNAQIIFAGAANHSVTNSGGVNPTGAWAINKSTGRVVLGSNLSLTDGQQLTITSGTLDQANFNLQTSALLSVGTNGILRNFGTGNLTLGGDVSNSGIININGGGTACGDPNGADPLQIRSTAATTVRTWSGNGTFSLIDVDVDSQAASTPPGTITAFGSSVLGPNMGAGWTLNSGCPVEINSQPTNQTACLGSSASFSVGATGTGLTFQWRRAGTPLSNGGNITIFSGPNSSTLTIDPVGAGDAASYDVVVTSSLGLTATSNPATLSLLSPPAITTNPSDTNVCAGATASFTAAASGNPTPTVQWQESIDGGANFDDISGATSTSLSFTASASQNGNKYRAVFANSCSSATTTAATLTVNASDLAIDKSHSGDFTVGTNGVYSITVTNAGACSTTGTITVTDTLPNGLSFVSGNGTNWTCSATEQDVTCTNTGPLAGGAVSTITLTVGVAQAAVPAVTNTATVSTPNDGNASNNSDSDPTTVNGVGPPINPGDLIISEFRVRGPNGAGDEFVEIYNNTDSNITVQATDGSSGFALVASDGVARFVIPNTTIIPARGHFLGVNSLGYSLHDYPGGNAPAGSKGVPPRPRREPRPSAEGSWDLSEDTVTVGGAPQPLTPTATGDVSYTTDILDNSGIALFNTANPENFTMANRLDAVGAAAETNTLYKEGPGHPNLNPDLLPADTEYSWVRRLPGSCTGTDPAGFNNNCTTTTLVQNTAPPSLGRSQDTNDNAADFLFVSTIGGTGAGLSEDLQRLGAPGPENLSAPIVRGNPSGSGTINPSLIDPAVASSISPNRERVTCPTPGTCGANQEFGTLDIRRRFTNNTGMDITRLRFRIMDISTFPNGPGIADLRALSSPDVMVTVTGGGTVTVRGTTVEEDTSAPNLGQHMGGGYNSSLSAGVITLATPLNPGASVNMRFVFGVQSNGKFRVFVVVEALP